MSYSIDANLLLYASDESSPHHQAAIAFIESLPENPDLLCLCWPTMMSYLRISTHPSVFASPLSPEEALANIDDLLALPRARVITEQDDFTTAYRETTAGLSVRGNLVPDAHLVTLLQQNGVRTLYTNDRDFLRFSFLEVRNPLEQGS